MINTKLETCTIKFSTAKELFDIETFCFNRGFIWYINYNRKHRDFKDMIHIQYIKINVHEKQMYGRCDYDIDYKQYTATEFIKKYINAKNITLNENLYKKRTINLNQNN